MRRPARLAAIGADFILSVFRLSARCPAPGLSGLALGSRAWRAVLLASRRLPPDARTQSKGISPCAQGKKPFAQASESQSQGYSPCTQR
ncbi:hypothetical protein BJL95_00770 [Methylomonas sp. LWB]|nr:hypothetical protein BJL95_00770 [Methylomonas sp. LWB]